MSLIFTGLEVLVTIHLLLSLVVSFSWVWWVHKVTPVTFIDVGVVTMPYDYIL